jgi:hypothetical protein
MGHVYIKLHEKKLPLPNKKPERACRQLEAEVVDLV